MDQGSEYPLRIAHWSANYCLYIDCSVSNTSTDFRKRFADEKNPSREPLAGEADDDGLFARPHHPENSIRE
ncbi:MAG: hypothetical protein M3Y28_06685 [Armatimonadota bacterium]|nr:hypothetical protein [Armatimonadota bacterium]